MEMENKKKTVKQRYAQQIENLQNNVLGQTQEVKEKILREHKPKVEFEEKMKIRLQELEKKHEIKKPKKLTIEKFMKKRKQ